MTDAMRQNIVDRHNWRRARVVPAATNMMQMRWSRELEVMARHWAEACEFRDGLTHDQHRFIPGGMFVGQNMASHTSNINIAIDFWWDEKREYKYGTPYLQQINATKCGFMLGHYTQITWAETYLIGCASAHCGDNETVIVCNYGPAGNVVPFDRPYEAGVRCGKCKNCVEDGLCDCGDLFCDMGVIDPETCTCTLEADGLVPNFMNKQDCSLNCSGEDFSYCGKDLFNNCEDSWTARKCPHMCNVCPYAEKGYTTQENTSSA